MPEGVPVIEECQISRDEKIWFVGKQCMAYRGAGGAINATSATVAKDPDPSFLCPKSDETGIQHAHADGQAVFCWARP